MKACSFLCAAVLAAVVPSLSAQTTSTPSVPDLIQYQFNEIRGDRVANTASGTTAPAQGKVSNTGWHGQAQSAKFGPNRPGFGMMAQTSTASRNGVVTGYTLRITGDMSVTWWQKMVSTAPANAFGYTFGGAGSNFRAFNRGASGSSLLFRGTAYGDVNFTTNLHDNNWHHLALVIDDGNGQVRTYVDGVLSNTVTGTANSHSSTNTGFNVGYHTSIASNHARYYDMDDFRFYTRAITPAEVRGAMLENASAGSYGTSCVSSGTAPSIVGFGRPTAGNPLFQAKMTGAAPFSPSAMVLGLLPGTTGYPVDISAVVAPGCKLEVPVLLLSLGATNAQGETILGLPIPNNIPEGAHAYVQGAYIGTGRRGATDMLDVNVQKN